MIFQCVMVVQNSTASLFPTTESARQFDWICAIVLLAIVVIFHIIWGIFIGLKVKTLIYNPLLRYTVENLNPNEVCQKVHSSSEYFLSTCISLYFDSPKQVRKRNSLITKQKNDYDDLCEEINQAWLQRRAGKEQTKTYKQQAEEAVSTRYSLSTTKIDVDKFYNSLDNFYFFLRDTTEERNHTRRGAGYIVKMSRKRNTTNIWM